MVVLPRKSSGRPRTVRSRGGPREEVFVNLFCLDVAPEPSGKSFPRAVNSDSTSNSTQHQSF